MNKHLPWALAGTAVAAAIAAVAIGVLHTRPAAKPTVDVAILSPEQVMARMKSGEIKELPQEDRRTAMHTLFEDPETFRELMRDESLGDEERERVRETMRETFRAEQEARVKEYFALPAEEREAYLDKLVDEMSERFQRWQDGRREEPPGGEAANRDGEGERRGPTLDRMRERIESSDPAERAQQAEFRRAMRARMEARGIARPWPGGGGR